MYINKFSSRFFLKIQSVLLFKLWNLTEERTFKVFLFVFVCLFYFNLSEGLQRDNYKQTYKLRSYNTRLMDLKNIIEKKKCLITIYNTQSAAYI